MSNVPKTSIGQQPYCLKITGPNVCVRAWQPLGLFLLCTYRTGFYTKYKKHRQNKEVDKDLCTSTHSPGHHYLQQKWLFCSINPACLHFSMWVLKFKNTCFHLFLVHLSTADPLQHIQTCARPRHVALAPSFATGTPFCHLQISPSASTSVGDIWCLKIGQLCSQLLLDITDTSTLSWERERSPCKASY